MRGLKTEETEEEIIGYTFIDEKNFKVVCENCITVKERERSKKYSKGNINIINKRSKGSENFLFCDRCGKII